MPQPKPNEKQNEYIARCVKQVMSEGKNQKEALGQCYGMWRQAEKTEIFKSLTEAMEFLNNKMKSGNKTSIKCNCLNKG